MSPRSHRSTYTESSGKSPLLPSIHQEAERGINGDTWEEGSVTDGYNGASYWSAVFNLSTSIVGAGIMGLPAAMRIVGLVPGLILVVLAGFVANASLEILVKFSHASKSLSYAGVMADTFGRVGRILLQCCVVLNNFGILVVYLIIIADVLSGSDSSGVHHKGVFEEWAGTSTWWNSRVFVLFSTTVLVLVPLSSFKHVDSLKLSSALSVALALVFVVVTSGIAIVKLILGDIDMPKLFPDIESAASFLELFGVVPVLVTVYICHHSVHPILNELKDTSQERGIVHTSILMCTSIYVATSLSAFLLFGEKTMDDVLSNFDEDLGIPLSNVLSDIVRIGYAAHLMLVFPLLHFSLRLNLDGLIFPCSPPLSRDLRRFSLITASLIILVFLAASLIPSIWDAFQFTGATAGVCLGFIFPAIIVLRDVHGVATRPEKILSWIMVVLAVASNGIAIVSDAYGLIAKNKEGLTQSISLGKVDL